MAIAKFITSWSFSRWSVYQLCAFKAKCKFLLKLPEPGSAALDRGNDIHKMAENFIKGLACIEPEVKEGGAVVQKQKVYKPGVMPPALTKFKPLFLDLAKRYKKKLPAMIVEETWAFRRDWSRTVYNDWTECWLRVKVDCAYEEKGDILYIRDWKTGKYHKDLHEEYLQTLKLYALGGMLALPHIKEVRCSLDYLDLGTSYPESGPLIFKRSQVSELKAYWEQATKAMMADRKFAPRPNAKCRFCAYSKKSGGPCKF